MTTIEQILVESFYSKSEELKDNSNSKDDLFSDGVKKTMQFQSDLIRKDKKDLYQMYLSNPIVFNTVNKYVQLCMSADRTFVAKDPKVVEFYTNFYDSIGESGSEMDQYTLMSDTLCHQFIGGEAWQENIFNKKGNKIVDFDMINPLSMDYAKDSTGKPVLNSYLEPVGYVQTVPSDEEIKVIQRFPAPEGVDVGANKLYLPLERVTHFKLFKVGDGLSGLGIVEPIYQSSLRKLNSEKGFSEAAAKLGSPIIKAKVGDALHEPTPQQLQNTLKEITNINQKSALAHSYTTDVSLLEPRKPEKLKEYLDYFENVEVTGMGMPKAFSSGSGEATNRATLARQEYLMKLSLKEIIRRTTRTIEQKQLKPIAKQYGLKEVPKLVWGEISLEELDSKSKRLVAYAGAGLLKPNTKLEEFIKNLEKLPLGE